MKQLNKLAIIVLSGAILLFACTKDEDEDPTPQKSKTELLTAHEWIITNMVAAPPLDTVDIWLLQDDCIKDNIYTFSNGGGGNIDEGAKLCEPGDPQTIPIMWSLENDETVLQFIEDGDTVLIQEFEISSGKFTGNVPDIFLGYISVTFEDN